NLDRGLERFTALATAFPNEPAYRAGRADCLTALGFCQATPEHTATCLGAALALYEDLVRLYPDSAVYRTGLAVGHHNLGNLAFKRRKMTEAEAHLRLALAWRTELAREQPELREHRIALAQTQSS